MDNLGSTLFITPQEAIEQSPYNTTLDFATFCDKTFKEFYKNRPSEQAPLIRGEGAFLFIELMTILFNAGRVQGIRQERQKRGACRPDNTIDRDNISMAAVYLDSAKYIHEDIVENYIDRLNPENTDPTKWMLAYREMRAKSNAVCMLHNDLKQILDENGITM